MPQIIYPHLSLNREKFGNLSRFLSGYIIFFEAPKLFLAREERENNIPILETKFFEKTWFFVMKCSRSKSFSRKTFAATGYLAATPHCPLRQSLIVIHIFLSIRISDS
jgi:hypothetical protein